MKRKHKTLQSDESTSGTLDTKYVQNSDNIKKPEASDGTTTSISATKIIQVKRKHEMPEIIEMCN